MQKLLSRSFCAPDPPILSVNTLPFHASCLFCSGFFSGASNFGPKMSSSASVLRLPHHRIHIQRSPFFTSTAQSLRVMEIATSSFWAENCGGFRNGCSTVTSRGWVVSEKNAYGCIVGCRQRAWFTALAENSGSGGELSADGGNDVENVKGAAEERRVVKRRGGISGGDRAAVLSSPDLLKIPGVGPRNLRKLVDKGFEGVAELKQLYKEKFFGKSSQKMVEFLQSSVGIIHKHHAESITTFIKESVDEELKENDLKPVQKKRITLCVEGNISVGKTTFLQRIANETLELRDLVEIVPEPIDKWQDVGPDHFNILDAFYAEPERYAYTFQNYVFVTRVMQEKESSGGIKPLRLMERSVFSDRMVFVRAVHEAKWMNEMEISIYDSWFDPVVSSLPGLVPDGFIYLRASPGTCHKRMMLRKREEEGGVSLKYLQDLHEKHESWLFPFQSGNHRVLSVSKVTNSIDWRLHPNIRDRVFYLDGDHLHSSIQKVPALVLDCEPDIDFIRDTEAKQEYARQVAEFFEFVKRSKKVSASNAGEDATKSNHPQVLLPHNGNLWMLGTQPFPCSPHKSLDFRRSATAPFSP
ncbi:uncharacterized protein [Primulina eburnea]|uniref:uncharacterized protein n=1 Tax=Primulina eburnea TaxID=1245227 RepID=UPI003C6C404C